MSRRITSSLFALLFLCIVLVIPSASVLAADPTEPTTPTVGEQTEQPEQSEPTDPPAPEQEDQGLLSMVSGAIESAIGFVGELYNRITGWIDDVYNATVGTVLDTLLWSIAYLPVEGNTQLNHNIAGIYDYLYPFGVAIMLICWTIRLTGSGMTVAFDIKAKDSLIHSILYIMIGFAVLGIAPGFLTMLFGLSAQLTTGILSHTTQSVFGGIVSSSPLNTASFGLSVYILKLVYMLNIIYLAVLQAFSPIFVGFAAGGVATRKIAVNFLKEYIKCCLIPIVSTAYMVFILDVIGHITALDLLGGVVLSVGGCGFAGRRIEKWLA